MTDLLSSLSAVKYGSIELETVINYSWNFENSFKKYKFVFKDREFIQPLGRLNKVFKFTIGFYDDFGLSTKKHFYHDSFQSFIKLCEYTKTNGTLETLITPDLGSFTVICSNLNVKYDPVKIRNGSTVDVEFIEAPDLSQEYVAEYTSLMSVDAIYPIAEEIDKMEPPTEVPHRPNILETVRNIRRTADRVDGSITRTQNSIDRSIGEIDAMNESIDKLTEPRNIWIKRKSQKIKNSLVNTRDAITGGISNIKTTVIDTPATVMVVAKNLRMTVQELLDLNPELASKPMVGKGNILKYRDTAQVKQ